MQCYTLRPPALPNNVEIFYIDERTAKMTEPGWYYWYCSPGCLPDGPAIGPYNSEQQAIEAYQKTLIP